MITNIHDGRFGLEGNLRWELFDRELEVSIDRGADINYAEKCAEALVNLPDDTVQSIFEAAKRNFLFFCEYVGHDFNEDMDVKIYPDTHAEEIRADIFPHVFIVDKPKDERVGFHIECDCCWEPEHGLEITILDGRLVYLGPFEDNGPWGKYPEDDEWNFAVKRS
ncbi:MAG: hypothetical protein J1F03_07390 [Oscillospiraceae bacterium]|nr:hypothetical protein [Oscillospiraceae bacterium]